MSNLFKTAIISALMTIGVSSTISCKNDATTTQIGRDLVDTQLTVCRFFQNHKKNQASDTGAEFQASLDVIKGSLEKLVNSYSVDALRKIEHTYKDICYALGKEEMYKSSGPGIFGDQNHTERPMVLVDDSLCDCIEKILARIDSNLVPLVKVFEDNCFTKEGQSASLDFDDLFEINEDLDENRLSDIVGYALRSHKNFKEVAQYADLFKIFTRELYVWETAVNLCDFFASKDMKDVMTALNTNDSAKWGKAFEHYKSLVDSSNKNDIEALRKLYDIASIIAVDKITPSSKF